MKKRIILGLASVAIMAAAVCVAVSGVDANVNGSDLLSQNLEALTNVERTDPIWDIYLWASGAYDCSTGGEYTCSVTN